MVRFTRREARDWMGLSEKQARVHLDRLVELDYLLAHSGRHGQRFCYELLFDGDAGSNAPQAVGLIDVEKLRPRGRDAGGDADTTANFVASGKNLVVPEANLVHGSWPDSGRFVAGSCNQETTHPARTDAAITSLVAALPETAQERPARETPHRSNGASYAGAGPRSTAAAALGSLP